MKPVVVFRYSDTEGPGHFATFLDARRIAWRLVKLDEGERVPASSEDFAGLGFMGGPMSANDELAWTQPVLALMRDAARRKVPVIGHCLGGQMLARALGGKVTVNPVKEIGWNPVRVEDTPTARRWFGEDLRDFITFQWHGDTFTIPPGGERILTATHCPNQAYVVDDPPSRAAMPRRDDAGDDRSWIASRRGEVEANLASPRCSRWRNQAEERAAFRCSTTPPKFYRRWITKLRG